MSHGSEKANEFRRYRRVLQALFFTIIGIAFLILAGSVVRELYFRPVVQLDGPTLSAENPNPEDLLRCHNEVVTLFTDLDRTATRLIAMPPLALPTADASTSSKPDNKPDAKPDTKKDNERDVIGEWEQFSGAWMTQWDRTNAFCRFSELEDANMGEAYDRMAQVHMTLRAVRLKYQSLLVRYDDEQTAELSRIRRDLQSSRALLLRDRQGAGGEQAL